MALTFFLLLRFFVVTLIRISLVPIEKIEIKSCSHSESVCTDSHSYKLCLPDFFSSSKSPFRSIWYKSFGMSFLFHSLYIHSTLTYPLILFSYTWYQIQITTTTKRHVHNLNKEELHCDNVLFNNVLLFFISFYSVQCKQYTAAIESNNVILDIDTVLN